jgi:hypothetical protein
MIEIDSGIEVHVCAYCGYAIRDEVPITDTAEGWRAVTLDDGPAVPTWHASCAADIDEERKSS